jgi:hypothetical protein
MLWLYAPLSEVAQDADVASHVRGAHSAPLFVVSTLDQYIVLQDAVVDRHFAAFSDAVLVLDMPKCPPSRFALCPRVRHLVITDHRGELAALTNLSLGRNGADPSCMLNSLAFCRLRALRTIGGAEFMSNLPELQRIDLQGLENVEDIGDHFMSDCGMTSISLAPLRNVRSIGNSFLWRCSGLTSIDLQGLENVEDIGDDFMSECGMTSISLAPLRNVREVGSHFLSECTALVSVDLESLSKEQASLLQRHLGLVAGGRKR